MPEVEVPVKVVAKRMICDRCGAGEMLPDASGMLLTHPPKWRHKCTSCGAESVYRVKYPDVGFVLGAFVVPGGVSPAVSPAVPDPAGGINGKNER